MNVPQSLHNPATTIIAPNENRHADGLRERRRKKRRDLDPNSVGPVVCQSPLIHKPTSAENTLRLKAADQLDWLHLTASWFKLIPCHIGKNETVDMAACLFIQSNEIGPRAPSPGAFHPPPVPLYESYWRLYGRTLGSLRRLMSSSNGALSDEALLSCALLAHSERGMGFQSRSKDVALKNTLSHLHGIQAILTARPATREPSELSFSILSGQQILLYEAPVALGIASPFESMAWFQPPPSGSPSPSVQLERLRLIGQRLLVDLPRLEMYISRANKVSKKSSSAASFWATRTLAKRLLARRDDVAEDVLLHRVKVGKTTNSEYAKSISYSYSFCSIVDFEAGMYYWQSRLMVLRLCWRIARFEHSLNQEDIVAEGVRVARNLLMSWQYGEEQRMFGLIRYVFACRVIWGAVMDFQDAFDDVVGLRRCLIKRISQFMEGIYGPLNEEKLDDVAKRLDGDSSDGPMARLYQQSWPGRVPSAQPRETTAQSKPDLRELDSTDVWLSLKKVP